MRGRGGEGVRIGVEQVADPGQREPGLGQRADPDELYDRRGVVAVAGVVPLGLWQQPDLVVVAHGTHRHPGVPAS